MTRRAETTKKSQDFALEGVEISEALADRFKDDFVVHASVFVNEKVPEPFHASQGVRHRGRNHAPLDQLFKEVIFLARQTETEPRHEKGANVNRRFH